MDDSWKAKCGTFGGSSSSAWSLPPPLVPMAATPFPAPLPPALPTVPVLAQGMTGSVGQVEINPRQHLVDFYMQDALLKSVSEALSKDQCLVQEKLSFRNINSDFSKTGKMELGGPFFTLLSGNLSEIPASRPALSKSHHSKDETVQSVTFSGLPVTTLPTLLQSHQNNSPGNWNALSSIVDSRPYKNSGVAKSHVVQKSLQAVVSSENVGVDKVAHKQTSRAQTANVESTSWHQCPTSSVTGTSRNQHNVKSALENPFQPNQFVSHSSSSLLKGRPRVFCRNTVGYLFMDNNGLIGVICFCHSFPMSVAKFCEHSGVSSANPADVVFLENGMTILQWSKQCLGVLTPGSNWNWSQDSSVNGDLLGTKTFNGPALNKMGRTYNPKVSDCSWRSREPLPVSSHGSTELGQSNPQEFANKELASRYEKDNSARHHLFTDNFSFPTQVTMSTTTTNNTPQAVIESPVSVHREKVYSTVQKGNNVLSQHSKANYIACAGKVAFPFDSTAVSASLTKKDGGPSNIELRLGHPCQNSYTFAGYPEAMLQFGASCSLQKPQFHKPLYAGIDKAKDAGKSRTNFQVTPSEASGSNGVDLKSYSKTVEVANASESSEVKNDAMKNSLISLFLSHLEMNKSTHSLDNVFTNEDSLTRMPTDGTLPVKTKFSRSLDVTDDFTEKSGTSILDFSKNTSEKKNVQPVDRIGVKSNYVVIIDQVAETENLASSLGINCSNGISLVDRNCQSTLIEPTPNILRKQNSGSSGFRVLSNNFAHDSENRASNVIEQPATLVSMAPTSSSAAPICPLEPISSLAQFISSHDETVKVPSPNHMAGLYKRGKSNDVLEASLPSKTLCCHPSVHFKPNVCNSDLALHMEREESHCRNHQDFSKLATRAFSPCSKCCSGCGADGLAGQPNQIGTCRCCCCLSSIQRLQPDSQDDEYKDAACKICGSHWRSCLRVGRDSNNWMADGHMHDKCNQREHNSCFCGKCCSMRNCVPACCVSGGNGTANISKEQRIQGQAKPKYLSSDYVRNYSAPEFKRIQFAHCNCLNNVALKNDDQTVYWRNVPEKACALSSATEKLAKPFGTSKLSVDQPANAAGKPCSKSDLESESMIAEHTCNGSTGSSTPVVTEVSIETKNLNTRTVNAGIASSNCGFVVDEGSEIEKCGSSDETVCGGKDNATKSSSTCLHSCSYGNDIGEPCPRNPSILKRSKFQTDGNCTGQENKNKKLKSDRSPSTWNRKENPGDNRFPESDFSSANLELHDSMDSNIFPLLEKEKENSDEPDNMKKCLASYPSGTVKRKRSALPATNSNFSIFFEIKQKVLLDDDMEPREHDCSLKRSELSDENKRMQNYVGESNLKMIVDAEKPPKYMSLNSILNTSNCKLTSFPRKAMPIVCGNSGIIYNEKTTSKQKPVKMVSLKLILEKNTQCNSTNTLERQEMTKMPKYETTGHVTNKSKGLCSWKRLGSNKQPFSISETGENPRIFKSPCSTVGSRNYGKFVDIATLNTTSESHLQPDKCVPKASSSSTHAQDEGSSCLGENDLYSKENILDKDMDPSQNACLSTDPMDRHVDLSETVRNQKGKIQDKDSVSCPYPANVISVASSSDNHENAGKLSVMNEERHAEEENSPCLEPNAACCVCGSINQDIRNKMIECNACFIRVHQACYGVSKVPKGVWQCRPCKINSQNIVCVLCGYDGGAMTRALKSQNIVQSLLRAWKVSSKSSTASQIPAFETLIDKTQKWSTIEASDRKTSGLDPSVDLINSKHPRIAMKMELKNQNIVAKSQQRAPENLHACNSIIAGLFDPSIVQWVHMVCGLWTPGTRCPNNDTMSAFDVSGASPAKRNAVCSLCNRAGGSYIKCRVQTCSTFFHPWCAHQKGFLQSETEGDDNDKVGFYGRCLHHATTRNDVPCDSHVVNPEECKNWSCARSEGFKGKKRAKKYGGGCIVSQEQRNAWLHINRLKSYKIGAVERSSSDVEHDFRKEYARYKQLKAWKNLIVYKSGIHALGLYTSQFIARGAMVVEYVGEIVGLRVADKREMEYQSGRRIQYKSACYFFRIDKEHIIDATRKGGIARFVNHSCLPNCVAKIISIKNEKKVVFFAERDINPGEEITYDYHFNREDEGEKISCFCNSKNCKQFLN